MSDQNLQWILNTAANRQQNPDQASHAGGPKVEKVFFTTAIPVGGNSGSSVQQIGLSLPVIIIKQEESCQCQCACRDSAKDKGSKKSGEATQPPPQETPRTPPPHVLPPTSPPTSGCLPPPSSDVNKTPLPQTGVIPGPGSSASAESFPSVATPITTDGLATMDMSDFLSLQSPESTANMEALILVANTDFTMASSSASSTTGT